MAKIAFFGTPDFSLPSLFQVYNFCKNNDHEFILIVTQPDKKQGRGQKLTSPIIKVEGMKMGIKVSQPKSLKKNTQDGDDFFSLWNSLKPDLAIVVAYGQIITKRILDVPTIGMINIHASLLPKYRGAAPIQRAIVNGDKLTGVCLMDIVLGLDEGDILAKEETIILASDTSQSLAHRLSLLGANLLLRNLDNIIFKKIKRTPQDEKKATYAVMINKDEGLINFNQPGQKLNCLVRGLDPWPSVYGFINGKRVKFFNSFFIPTHKSFRLMKPGRIATIKPCLGIECQDGIVYFFYIQWEGKKPQCSSKAIKSQDIKVGDIIGN